MQSFAVARIAAALIAFATCLLPVQASAQQQTTFCLEGGLRISVERFEIRDGKFVLYVAGSATPIEYPSNVVKGINVPCSSAGQAKAYESSELLSSDAEHDVKGIGFIGLPYIGRNTALAISSSCGIASHPSKFSVKTEEYPLARRLYLYTIGTPANSTARDLLEFALSDDAQATVKEAEFVDQAIDFQDDDAQRNWANGIGDDPTRGLPSAKSVPGAAVEAFARAMDRAHRTPIAFRFEKGSAELDNRALQDVARLARYLSAPQQSGKRYLIAGFADATGSWGTNRQLALRRAEAVVDELRQVGVRVPRESIASFSYLAPVACNDSDAGAAKNRRVEVWIWR